MEYHFIPLPLYKALQESYFPVFFVLIFITDISFMENLINYFVETTIQSVPRTYESTVS